MKLNELTKDIRRADLISLLNSSIRQLNQIKELMVNYNTAKANKISEIHTIIQKLKNDPAFSKKIESNEKLQDQWKLIKKKYRDASNLPSPIEIIKAIDVAVNGLRKIGERIPNPENRKGITESDATDVFTSARKTIRNIMVNMGELYRQTSTESAWRKYIKSSYDVISDVSDLIEKESSNLGLADDTENKVSN